MATNESQELVNAVAIIGMAGRFPGAGDVHQFWRNQVEGVESISHFTADELEVRDAHRLIQDPNYVAARSVLAGVDLFDASFFGIYPKEAELMDPQHRVFLECCWEALEDAGYDPSNTTGLTGVYAGCSPCTYLLRNVCRDRRFIDDYVSGYQVQGYPVTLGSNGDFLATRVSYKLNLKGPSFTILSACSTSLVAVSQACQGLQAYQCDTALAGGVSITFPQQRGYMYQEGGMGSRDGHCRPFDQGANGTVFGSGAGVVLLKRLEDAIADGDHVYAIIRGYSVNNDGAGKVGYTAPSVEAQAQVIAMAHAAAGVDPETITYVEAHGTATPLGDPIEVAALTQAFRASTKATGFCALGTAKANVGHLDIAAGVTGLIHAVQAIRHAVLPRTLHFSRPNSKLDLGNSPFYVNSQLQEWKPALGMPRRAGVSAMGVGGTNAHVILEQAPDTAIAKPSHSRQLLVLSARSETALQEVAGNLAVYLEGNPNLELADVAHTLQTGRRHFEYRAALVASDVQDAVEVLRFGGQRFQTSHHQFRNQRLCFMFPGQGAQYLGMGAGLYAEVPVFRQAVDECAVHLISHLGFDLRSVMFSSGTSSAADQAQLTRTESAQCGIFTIEYALAQMWRAWGIEPFALIGHSVGEFVAACLAGVFSLEDALSLVAVRGKLMQALPTGAMLSVRVPESEVRSLLSENVSLAASNGPALSVVSGPFEAIESLEKTLDDRGIVYRRLITSHAFHSAMMDPAVGPFTEQVKRIRLNAPSIPYVSTVTGTWVTPAQAMDPEYWGSHLRKPVCFSAAIAELLKTPELVLLEVGPGITLNTLARQHAPRSVDQVIVSSLAGCPGTPDFSSILTAVGTLWRSGLQPDWLKIRAEEPRRRVSLPTYPFERKRFWIDPPPFEAEQPQPADLSGRVPQEAVLVMTTPEVPADHERPATILKDQSPAIESTIQPRMNRHDRIKTTLREVIDDLSGISVPESDSDTSFLDMGFDSLFLTQVTQSIQNKLGVKITFRQLLDQQSTLNALATFIDGMLPADVPVSHELQTVEAPQPAEPVATPPVTAPLQASMIRSGEAIETVPVNASRAERIIRDQLQAMTQLMAQQLEVLRGSGPMAAEVIAAVPAAPQPSAKLVSDIASAAPPAAPSISTEPAKPDFKPFGPYKPVQKALSGKLTLQQEQSLAALVERYTRRTAGSKKTTQQHRKVLADPRVVSGFRSAWKEMVYPIVTVRSRGSRLWDVDGNEYIDILNGFGPTVFGHLPEFVTKAVLHQLEQGIEIGPQSPLAGKVAEMISGLTGMERVTFCNTGSEAVMAGIRVARTVTARKKIVIFAGSYHGTFDEVLAKGIKTKSGDPRSSPIAPGIPQEKVDNIIVLEYGAPESLSYIRAHAHELAAVLVEPVQSRHLDLQPKEFCQQIREITRASGTALIFDEVVTGFRSHPGGVQALWDIRADLATYGKVLGGGLPIGVLAGSAEYMDALDGGTWSYGNDSSPEKGVTFFAGTFVRHPLALAACESVLTHLKEQGPELQERLNARTAALAKELNLFFEQNEVPMHIQQFSSVFYFAFPPEQTFGSLFYYHLRTKGVHIQEGFPCFLTTAHSEDDIQHVIRSFRESALEMQAEGFWPAPRLQRADAEPATPATGVEKQASAPAAPRKAALTESQLEVLLSAQMGREASCSFNESISIHLRGPLDEPALRAALQRLLNRHDALRATFSPHGESQIFAPEFPLNLPLSDFSADPAGQRDEQVKALLDAEAREPFDLLRGPMVRMRLVRLEPQKHLLLFTAHHIVCDGWSTNVLLDELSKLYSSLHNGTPCELPAPFAFEAYTATQAKHFESTEGAEAGDYWVAQFKTPTPLLDLPLDRARPSIKGYDGATFRSRISVDTYKAVKKAGAQQKCTLFVTLLAAFQTLLSKLSGQDDIVVGIPAAGQALLDDEVLVGHCVNFLPLRGHPAGDLKFSDYLTQARSTLLDAYDHQNYTYGRLIRKLSIPRDPSRLPLVEVQFNLERVGTGMEFADLEVEVDPNPKAFVNHDLFLNVIESDGGLLLDCDYNTLLFDESTIRRWMGYYATLVESIAEDPTRLISNLSLLSKEEVQRIAVEWNQTQRDYPRHLCVHQWFQQQVSQTPGAVAVVYEDQQLTYSELNGRANQVSRYLSKLGVRSGSLVGVFVDRSMEMIIGLLGILKSGAAYVPMDPTYPAERISFVLDDSKVSVLLTQETLAQALKPSETQLVYLDRDWHAIREESDSELAITTSPDQLAYVIYTSGSTGRPKGVEISHRALVNLLNSMSRKPGLNSNDTLLAVTTLSFDIAGLELFLPLCVGAKLVIATRAAAADGNKLLERMRDVSATVLQATPITWKLLLEAGWDGTPPLKILCGGEAFPRELANELVQRSANVWNMYGPTETTIWSAAEIVTGGDGPVLIGAPIDNTQFYVLDPAGRLAPIGVAGELHIGGDGLARGYFHRPELTVEKFIPNPFSTDPHARLYKTGDLMRRLPDGNLEFMGRLDHQVKLRGFRIELGEIETLLATYPGVREAVVIVREDSSGDKRLVAYVTGEVQELTVTAVREFLDGRLPNYMLPSAIVKLDAMPLTPNRKVDRKALPAPDGGAGARPREHVPPRTEQEKVLAGIWAEVLHLDQVGITDNLFELGADSLHIFQIAARAGRAGISLAPALFLRFRTISSLLEQLHGAHGSATCVPAPPIVKVSREKYKTKRVVQ